MAENEPIDERSLNSGIVVLIVFIGLIGIVTTVIVVCMLKRKRDPHESAKVGTTNSENNNNNANENSAEMVNVQGDKTANASNSQLPVETDVEKDGSQLTNKGSQDRVHTKSQFKDDE